MVSTSSPNQPKSSMPQVHTNIHNVRTVSLVAIFIQIFTLYMDMTSIHTATLIALLVLLLANAYMVFIRWYHREDERRDVQQLLSGDWAHRFLHVFSLFGGAGLCLAIHMLSPALPTGMFALLYNLANYMSIVGSVACPLMEIYEGVHEKNAK